jgi:hypothetical protein
MFTCGMISPEAAGNVWAWARPAEKNATADSRLKKYTLVPVGSLIIAATKALPSLV